MKDQIKLREMKKKGEVADIVSQFLFICEVFHRLNLD